MTTPTGTAVRQRRCESCEGSGTKLAVVTRRLRLVEGEVLQRRVKCMDCRDGLRPER